MENMDIITAMRRTKSSFEPSVESHWTPGINKTYGRRRQRLFRGLIQLSAVKSAINNTGKIILQDHIEHCIVDAVEHGDKDAIKELETCNRQIYEIRIQVIQSGQTRRV